MIFFLIKFAILSKLHFLLKGNANKCRRDIETLVKKIKLETLS